MSIVSAITEVIRTTAILTGLIAGYFDYTRYDIPKQIHILMAILFTASMLANPVNTIVGLGEALAIIVYADDFAGFIFGVQDRFFIPTYAGAISGTCLINPALPGIVITMILQKRRKIQPAVAITVIVSIPVLIAYTLIF